MPQFYFLRHEGRLKKLALYTIRYIAAEKKHVTIYTENQSYITDVPLNCFEEGLPASLFCRIHRSTIISLVHLTDLDAYFAYIHGQQLPIARRYRELLQSKIFVLGQDCIHNKPLSFLDFENLFGRPGFS